MQAADVIEDNDYLVRPPNVMQMVLPQQSEMFEWLNYCNKCLPMIIRKDVYFYWYLTFVAGTVVSNLMVFSFFVFYSIQHHMHGEHKDDIMYSSVLSLAYLLKMIAQILTIYYYHQQFDYPWDQFSKYALQQYRAEITVSNRRLLRWFIIAWMLITAQIINQTVSLINEECTLSQYLLFYIDLYFAEIPSMIAQFSCSVILLHSLLDLKKLMQDIHMDSLNGVHRQICFVDVNNAYKEALSNLRKQYRLWSMIMLFKILSILLWYWMTFTHYTAFSKSPTKAILWCLWYSIILVEFVYSADAVTTTFYKFKDKLDLIGDYYSFLESNDYCDYLYVLNYVSNHQLVIVFVSDYGEISIKNACLYFVVFAFCMLLTYQIV